MMLENDTSQRFMFEHENIRGELVHLESVYQTIMQQRPYPAVVRQLLGEALISCLLLVSSLKFEGEINLQFSGDERLPLLLVQCDHQLRVRAFAKYQEETPEMDYQAAFLAGQMSLVVSPHRSTQAYQSIVPITTASMATNLMHYFAQSEQISTYVWLAVGEDKAAGMMLQLMPGQETLEREQFWEYAIHVGRTIQENELLNLDNTTILHRLYHETSVRLHPFRFVQFQCRCDREKMKHVLSVIGQEEIEALLAEKGQVEIICDFCNTQYHFDSIDVAVLFRHH